MLSEVSIFLTICETGLWLIWIYRLSLCLFLLLQAQGYQLCCTLEELDWFSLKKSPPHQRVHLGFNSNLLLKTIVDHQSHAKCYAEKINNTMAIKTYKHTLRSGHLTMHLCLIFYLHILWKIHFIIFSMSTIIRTELAWRYNFYVNYNICKVLTTLLLCFMFNISLYTPVITILEQLDPNSNNIHMPNCQHLITERSDLTIGRKLVDT